MAVCLLDFLLPHFMQGLAKIMAFSLASCSVRSRHVFVHNRRARQNGVRGGGGWIFKKISANIEGCTHAKNPTYFYEIWNLTRPLRAWGHREQYTIGGDFFFFLNPYSLDWKIVGTEDNIVFWIGRSTYLRLVVGRSLMTNNGGVALKPPCRLSGGGGEEIEEKWN